MEKIAFENAGFRDFYHRFIYIECPEIIDELAEHIEVMDGADGVLAYGFVEGNQGTTFALLNSGKIVDGKLELGPCVFHPDDMTRLRYKDVEYYTFTPAEEFGIDLSQYDYVKEIIADKIETKDRLLQNIYNLEVIDGSRDPVAPDYVTVIVDNPMYPELIWARITGFGPDYILGEALAASQLPGSDIEKDQLIGFRIMDFGDRISLHYDPSIVVDKIRS